MSNTTSRESIRISGTPEAIKAYLAENFSVDSKDLEKVYNFLLIEDIFQTLKVCDNLSRDDIRDNINATVCQGMLLDTRVFLNTDNFKIEIYKKLPSEILGLLVGLLTSDSDQKIIRTLAQSFFSITVVLAKALRDNGCIVGDDAICVCMLAWKFACENRDVPFGVENIMPQDNCPFQGENGDINKKSFGRTSWRCEMPPTESSSERHCKLTKEYVKKTLEELEDKGVLTCFSIEKASYLFL